MAENMKFELLASSIKEISAKASNAAKRAVNQSMTLRNWAIGYYIVEYGKIGVNGTAYRSNRNTYRLKRYTFPHIINLYFYCFPPFAILMM